MSCNVNVPRGIMRSAVKLGASCSARKAIPDSRYICSHCRLLIVSLLCSNDSWEILTCSFIKEFQITVVDLTNSTESLSNPGVLAAGMKFD
jgi:hypothetical protein